MKMSRDELIQRAADAILGPTDNIRGRIVGKINEYIAAHEVEPSIIYLTRTQMATVASMVDPPLPVGASLLQCKVLGVDAKVGNRFHVV